jgi:hypothetical protein
MAKVLAGLAFVLAAMLALSRPADAAAPRARGVSAKGPAVQTELSARHRRILRRHVVVRRAWVPGLEPNPPRLGWPLYANYPFCQPWTGDPCYRYYPVPAGYDFLGGWYY